MTPHLDAGVVEPHLTWSGVMDTIERGHHLARAEVDDTLLRRREDSVLSRAALIDGLGVLVKTATVYPGNASRGIASINGSVALFDDVTGVLVATIDFDLLTRWKTAADSALAARHLARADSGHIVIVGAGNVAQAMIDAYGAVFPGAVFTIWNRSPERAEELAEITGAGFVSRLETALVAADIVCTATMSTDPLVVGELVEPGTHIDLIGGYRRDMREADDRLVEKASVFVDCVDTALDVGDIAEPVASGLLDSTRLLDFGNIADGSFRREHDDQITMFKNAGGAHLDLMVARHMFDAVQTAD
ncbi:MAG: ornithine cyclodeaminase family protein [Ilumatobacter sp.]